MILADRVRTALAASPPAISHNSAALAEAERLADVYADIKPVPFIVPIERFSGLPFESKMAKYAR